MIFNIVFNIDDNKNVFLSTKYCIYIFYGSCDTEDWHNDAENLALPSQEYILNVY